MMIGCVKLKMANELGFSLGDIKRCIAQLTEDDYLRTNPVQKGPDTMMDHYATTFEGENIYLHFYIHLDLDKVIVGSFKYDDGAS